MWKAAFTGRSETASSSGRPSSQRKKSSGSLRKSEGESRRSAKSSKGSTYGDDDGTSSYATAPTSRANEPRSLTESAVRRLDDDEEEEGWEDEDRDVRSERKSVRSDGKKTKRKSEKARSRSTSRDRTDKRRSTRKDTDRSRGKSRAVDEGDERALPEMGSMSQFPGQFSGGVMGPTGTQEPMMSGALPTPNNQFGFTRADSYGAAADYYLDEGQSVMDQPGNRAHTPNMLVNPDTHLQAASVEAHPAADTGQGSAADFFSGKVSPVPTTTPLNSTPGRTSSSSKPSKKPSKSGRTSSLGTAAAAAATGLGLGAAVSGANSYYQSQNQTSSTSYQQSTNGTARPIKPSRHNSEPVSAGPSNVYYGPPNRQGSTSGNTGKQSSHSNAGLYAAGAAAAGLAAYEINQNHQQQPSTPTVSPYGGTAYGQSSYGQQRPYANTNMQQQHFHEHKGPMTRLKDGLLNLIASEEDTIKMEMYTEYIGVCKYCFDPRTLPTDAPRRHHYHSLKRDSFEELRRRKSIDRMRRSSREQLSRTGSTRVDKDSRYYADRRKSNSKTDLVGTGLAVAGVAAGANALFNSDRRDFDDTYSVKSGHREGSATRRRSRSSSREKRRRSSHGVVSRDSKAEYVTVRTKDGRIERRKVHRSRSRSGDRKTSLIGAAAGAALGASAIAATRQSRRSRDNSPIGAYVRRQSRSRSSSRGQGGGGLFGFFSPPQRKRRASKAKRSKKERGFFSFSNGSSASTDSELAFGASRTDLSLKRKSSTRSNTKRRSSSEHIAATVAGISATAAALAAAQNGQKLGKRSSRPELGPGNGVKKRQIARKQGRQDASDDEWEDELPSDVDDASSVASGLAFGGEDTKLSRRQSRESFGSQSSAGGLSAWGWRWGGKDKRKKRRTPQPPPYAEQPDASGFGSAATGIAAGALAGAALGSASRPSRDASTYTSSSTYPQEPLQYVDPRPLSDAGSLPGSRHASIPGAFDSYSPPNSRPTIAPLQQPKPVTPIKPAFTQDLRDFDDTRPSPRRTQSSPVQSSWGQDAALIGAAAIGTAAVIASQGRKSKDVRFGLTEEQERKHEEERRKQQQRADEERRRADRTRALKEEADRFAREQDVLRQRAEENKRAAEEKLERQRAEEEVESQRRLEREHQEREAAYERERQERERRERAEAYDREQARISAEIERKKQELEEQRNRDREQKSSKRRQSESKAADSPKSSSVGWGAVAAGAAVAGVGAVALADREREQKKDRASRSSDKQSREPYVAKVVTPPATKEVEISDDAFDDPDYFKRQRSRSPAEHARHVDDLAHKAADKVKSANRVIAENDAYYAEPAQSQADFFAPEELSRSSEGKTKVADPIGDNDVKVYSSTELDMRKKFEDEWGRTYAKPHSFAPRGVPKLDLITPTPPPEAQSRRSSTPSAKSPTQAEPSSKKSARSRSISWGADQTHVYDVPSPDSHVERDSYMDDHGPAITAAGVAAAAVVAGTAYNEIVVEPASSTDRRTYRAEDLVREARDAAGRDKEADVEVVNDRDAPAFTYRQPFYESVSDIVFKADSPGTEGAPPVRGFVEGEITDQNAVTEKSPRMPGGFDDDDEEPKPESRDVRLPSTTSSPSTSRDAKQATPSEPEEPAWEPSLSKKDKKKRDKAAKRSSTVDDYSTPSSSPSASRDTGAQPEDDLDLYMSKKDKKAREKAMKRSATLDDVTVTPTKTDVTATNSRASTQPEDDAEYYSISKSDKKKRDKTSKRGMSEEPAVVEEPFASVESPARTIEAEAEPAWELPLSKKDKKKKEKEAKKQGLADIAGAVMTAGGVAAVTAAAADEMSDSWSSSKKGKKSKKSRGVERDIRDLEPSESTQPEPTSTPPNERQSSGMPGGWDSEEKEKEVESPAEIVDPFQFLVEDAPTTKATSPPPETTAFDGFTTSKKSKKSKRDSLKYSEPSVSSPLRSEVPMESYFGDKSTPSRNIAITSNGHTEATDSTAPEALVKTTSPDENVSPRAAGISTDSRRSSDSPQRVSPDDIRSVVSDPTDARRQSRTDDFGVSSKYYGEPDTYDDTRSVAVSEPVDPYEAVRRTKRRSKRDDDDTMSTVSSRSRREKDEPSSKDKKGFFGIFSRKSGDNVPRADGASLSRRSTRDSKDDEAEDDERRTRKKKHRSSEYGDDDDTTSVVSESTRKRRSRSEKGEDDDTRSVMSEYTRKHRSRSEKDEDGQDSRRSSRYGDEHYETRNGDDSERHHQRRKTDEPVDDQEQSFLGKRVEDMPPLPDNPRDAFDSATQEQGHGILDSAGSKARVISGDQTAAVVRSPDEDELDHDQPEVAASTTHDVGSKDKRLSWSDDVKYLPALPESAPTSPTDYAEATPGSRPLQPQRPTSTTAVPLRFPFGHQPVTPSPRVERAASFGGGGLPSPASPLSSQKSRQGRPASTEIRPLYLVERNRQIPALEESLPSLPSSKTTSRASSMVGSDEYESAVEDHTPSQRRRGLTIDTSRTIDDWQDEDYLGSTQTTPRATHAPDPVHDRPAKQEPQFYTWEDYAQDERMHESATEPSTATKDGFPSDVASQAERRLDEPMDDLPALPPSRPESRTEAKHGSDSTKGVLAAAALGGAAVLGYQALKHDDEPTTTEKAASGPGHDQPIDVQDKPSAGSSRAAAADTSRKAKSSIFSPFFSRSSSSKKKDKKDKKGKKSKKPSDEPTEEEVVEPASIVETPSRDTDDFLAEEEIAEEGQSNVEIQQEVREAPPRTSGIDDFMDVEERLESGDLVGNSTANVDPSELQATPIRNTDVDVFMDVEERLEAGEPIHQAVEDEETTTVRDAEGQMDDVDMARQTGIDEAATGAANDVSREINEDSAPLTANDDTWQPTRKLSKKEKKKQKGAKSQTIPDPAAVTAGTPAAVVLSGSDEQGRDTTVEPEVSHLDAATDDLPSLAPITSQGSASLSNIFQGATDNLDAGGKASPSTLASSAAATVHTSMDTSEHGASDRLSLSLEEEKPHSGATEEPPREIAEEKPILQPEEEEPWGFTTTSSRKKNKKDKKKRRSQIDVFDDAGESSSAANEESSRAMATVQEETPTVSSDLTPPAQVQAESVPLPETNDMDLDEVSEPSVPHMEPAVTEPSVETSESVDGPADSRDIEDSSMELQANTVPLPETEDMDLDEISERPMQIEPIPLTPEATNTPEPSKDVEMRDNDEADAAADTEQDLPSTAADDTDRNLTTINPLDAALAPLAVTEDSSANHASISHQPETVAEPPTQPDDEDVGFSWAPPKKKGKKGKKGKEPIVDESAERRLSEPTVTTTPADVEQPVPEAAEDTWSSLPSKKKGKKGKKNRVSAFDDLPAEPAIASAVAEGSEAVGESSDVVDAAEEPPTVSVPEKTVRIEDPETGDTFLPASTVAVEYGDTEVAARQLDAPEVEETATPVEDTHTEPTPVPADIEEQSQTERDAFVTNDAMETATAFKDADLLAEDADTSSGPTPIPASPVEETTPDVAWPISSSKKKGKKGKKSKAAAAEPEPVPETVPDATPAAVDPPEDASRDVDMTEEPPPAEVEAEADADSMWAMPAKGKKGKKGKKSQAGFVAAETIATASSSDTDAFQQPAAVTPTERDAASAAVDSTEQDDFWSARVKDKKGKKSKKNKRATIDWSAPEESLEPKPELAETVQVAVGNDDGDVPMAAAADPADPNDEDQRDIQPEDVNPFEGSSEASQLASALPTHSTQHRG